MRLQIIMFLFLIVLLSLSQNSQATVDWRSVGLFGGSCQAVAVKGNKAFAGVGAKLITLDVSAPSNPLQIGATLPFNDSIQDIAIVNDLAYVAVGAAGIGIANIADPSHPSILSTWDTRGYAEGIAVAGNTVYIADGPDGLRVLDVTDPVRPAEIGSVFPFNYALGVVVSGRYVYVAAGGAGLLIADVNDPSRPVEIGRYDTPGYAYGLFLIGSTAYIADAWGGIHAVDVSNPALPVLLGVCSTPGWALSVAAVGTTLYVADGADGVRLLDVSNSASMHEVGAYTGGGFARRVTTAGSMLYVADTDQGVQIINAISAAQPVNVGGYGELAEARWVTVVGNYAYIAGGKAGNMAIIDISDLTNPRQVSVFQGAGYASGVIVSGNYAYLSTFESTPNYLWVLNITDPVHPVQAAVISQSSLSPIWGAPRETVLQGNYIYVADEFGLRIFDISVPENIYSIGQIQLNGSGQDTVGVAVSGRYAYIAGAMAGVRIIDVNIPSTPQLVGSFTTSGFNQSVAVSGNRLYAGNGDGTLQVVDVSDPAHPIELGRYRNPGTIYGLSVVNNQLFVSSGGGGVQILDVTDPAAITVIDSLETSGEARQSLLLGNVLYVADGSGGLGILQKQPIGTGKASLIDDGTNITSRQKNQPWQRVAPVLFNKKNLAFQPHTSSSGYKEVAAVVGTCTVTSATDSGVGSLRECLANAIAGVTITFSANIFPPTSPATISLLSPLPTITAGSITIDASNAGVILDGKSTIQNCIKVASSYNRIMGLQIMNFSGDGLLIDYPSQYNQIGGDRMTGNGPSGQGNVFSGNVNGIRILFASYNSVTGNMIGTDARGTVARGNQFGIMLSDETFHNRIGGISRGERNIISGNSLRGIIIMSRPDSWNAIVGNYIGTDITGMLAIPNGIGVGLETGASNNSIGGPTPAERNIISGNSNWGVVLSDSRSMQNSIIGNYIGTNATGTMALPNGGGILVWGAGFNRIGGTRSGEGNLISGNKLSGVSVGGLMVSDVVIIGNAIGTDVNGNATLGNGSGIDIYDSVKHNFVGGATSDEGNAIRGNGAGVQIRQAGTKYNSIAGNFISGNLLQGVYIHDYAAKNYIAKNIITDNSIGIMVSQGSFNTLRANVVTSNRTADIQLGDSGNQMLAAPVITFNNSNNIWGTACAGCLVDIFSGVNDQVGTFEGSTMADSTGFFIFSTSAVISASSIMATATDSQGNSSVFSLPKTGITEPPFQKWIINTANVSNAAVTCPTPVYNGGISFCTVKPAIGYGVIVTGCNGNLIGNTYTSGPITADCSVSVTAIARNASSSGNSQPTISDAVKVLVSVVGGTQLTESEKIRYDVAPLGSNGMPVGNGRIDAADVILILRRSIGIGIW